ncbi:hypothetical protein [Bacillus sp. SD088]|uniref:hypothetical protein n=1 Tax=Bacillus sp. SD088 TaxID=2782012 RepID=UPI001A95E8B9|nr:hypothetical protein [Bacillus sp. SD088]MBO0993755.1 hypothetical protein [Bacillus sp. SD088]
MRKYIGIFIIIFGVIIAIGALAEFRHTPIASTIALLVISFPLYILGQLVRTSKVEMKRSGILWLKIFVFCLIILPLIFYSYELYEDMKWQAIDDGKYIFYKPGSNEFGSLSLLFLMALFLLIPIRLFSPELKRKRLMSTIIIMTIFLYGGFRYYMWLDYRGVHQELGLISQNWAGEQIVQSFSQIERIYVEPGLYQASLGDPTDETEFTWKMIFMNKNGMSTTYSFRSLSKDVLGNAFQMKAIAEEEDIPFIVNKMSNKEREWFDLELELKKWEKEPFYLFFEIEGT